MKGFDALGGGMVVGPVDQGGKTEFVQTERVLRRVLAFRGKSIDDVVNCPFVKGEVAGYYKLHRAIERRAEVVELERQWNELGIRG